MTGKQKAVVPVPWQQVAWNGVGFSAPPSWRVGTIGKHYVMMEDDIGPVMEIKWQSDSRPDALKTVFNRIVRQQKKVSGNSIRRWPLPVSWKDAVDSYQAVGFDWYRLSSAGCGVILFCAECRQMTVIQFYRRHETDDESIFRQVLRTIRDHNSTGQTFWSIYHARFQVPCEFQLTHYRFEAGLLRLDFACRKQRLSVHRWGPASVILNRSTLSDFAERYFDFSGVRFHHFQKKVSGDSGFEWKSAADTRFWARLFPRAGYAWGRIWHLQQKNRIMAVHASSRQPFDVSRFERVCESYESF